MENHIKDDYTKKNIFKDIVGIITDIGTIGILVLIIMKLNTNIKITTSALIITAIVELIRLIVKYRKRI